MGIGENPQPGGREIHYRRGPAPGVVRAVGGGGPEELKRNDRAVAVAQCIEVFPVAVRVGEGVEQEERPHRYRERVPEQNAAFGQKVALCPGGVAAEPFFQNGGGDPPGVSGEVAHFAFERLLYGGAGVDVVEIVEEKLIPGVVEPLFVGFGIGSGGFQDQFFRLEESALRGGKLLFDRRNRGITPRGVVGELAFADRQIHRLDHVEIVFQRGEFDGAGFCGFEQPVQLFFVDAAAVVADAEEEGLVLVALGEEPIDPVEELLFLLPAGQGAVGLPDAQRDHLAAVVAAPAEEVGHALLLRHRAHEDVAVEAGRIQNLRQPGVLAEGVDAVADADLFAELLAEVAFPELRLPEQNFARRDDGVGLLDPAADQLPAPRVNQFPDSGEERRVARFDPLVAGTR